MAINEEFLAFAEMVRRSSLRIATLARAGKADQAGEAALSLCSHAAACKRQLLGLPEPDPDREYDPDFSTDDLNDLRKAGPASPGLGLE